MRTNTCFAPPAPQVWREFGEYQDSMYPKVHGVSGFQVPQNWRWTELVEVGI